MTTFDTREKAFESKFVQDTAVAFQIQAQALKNLAHWAANELGKSAEDSAAYVKTAIAHGIQDAQASPVIAKFAADLEAAGLPHDAKTVGARWQAFLQAAKDQVTPDPKVTKL